MKNRKKNKNKNKKKRWESMSRVKTYYNSNSDDFKKIAKL